MMKAHSIAGTKFLYNCIISNREIPVFDGGAFSGCPIYDIDGSWLAELRISTPVRDIDSEGEEERTYMTEWNDYHAIMLDGVVQECDVIVPIKLAAEYLFEWSEDIIRR